MKKLLIFAMLLAIPAAFAQEKPKLNPGVYANFETSMGNFTAELFEKDAPLTVANFIGLASGTKEWSDPKTGAKMNGKPFYNGLTFHRIIADFMIQGGDPTGTGTGGPGFTIKDEVKLKHDKPGRLAMAKTQLPNTNSCQFYITVAPTPFLDKEYTVFGQVIMGMDVVMAMSKVKTAAEKPVTPVVMKKVTIERVK